MPCKKDRKASAKLLCAKRVVGHSVRRWLIMLRPVPSRVCHALCKPPQRPRQTLPVSKRAASSAAPVRAPCPAPVISPVAGSLQNHLPLPRFVLAALAQNAPLKTPKGQCLLCVAAKPRLRALFPPTPKGASFVVSAVKARVKSCVLPSTARRAGCVPALGA